ncbi:hypothetical protein [Pseudoalteromonas sp. MMG005]|uniref:hypothetical protein n=1 Tax=Pseudoalteromonas sp. MMG005 TaxID=2822682 RepID=UPI001B3A2A2C|nr:hypothetical protein [Pseudoalteromonas sp. MMG005]MBQ4847933.1 hypothetical protein [Pseudoalteromonas sp. MMG005]
MKKIWISPSCFNCELYDQGGHITSKDEVKRAVDIWNHARSCLERDNPSEFDRSDSIGWLKRAMNQRLKLIEYIYSLKNFALPTSPKGYLEYLATLNIVRPFMLKTLMAVRNDIEHNDATPPDIERCLELLDLVWYFIRSTDELVKIQKCSIVFQESFNTEKESPYWLSIDIKFDEPYLINVYGWVESRKFSNEYKEGWFEVSVSDMGTKSNRWTDSENHSDKRDDDLWVRGELKPLPEQALSIIAAAINAD